MIKFSKIDEIDHLLAALKLYAESFDPSSEQFAEVSNMIFSIEYDFPWHRINGKFWRLTNE